ncbi:MAG: STAS domain-containing protein [Pseudomonadota bacterium]
MRLEVSDLDVSTRQIAISGSMDDPTVRRFKASFQRAVRRVDSDIVLEMSAVSFVGAAGIYLLLATRTALAEHGRSLVAFGCKPDIADLIRLVVPKSLLPVFATRRDALRFVAAQRLRLTDAPEASIAADRTRPVDPPVVPAEDRGSTRARCVAAA